MDAQSQSTRRTFSNKPSKLQKALKNIAHAIQQSHLRKWLTDKDNYSQICSIADASDNYVLVAPNSDKTTLTEIQYFPTMSKMSPIIQKLAEKDTPYAFAEVNRNIS